MALCPGGHVSKPKGICKNAIGLRRGLNRGLLVLVGLLPIGIEGRRVLGVGSISVAILHSCQHMKMLHHKCIDMNKVGW